MNTMHRVHSFSLKTQLGTLVIFQELGHHYFLKNQMVFSKRVWGVPMTRSALMLGQFLERKLRQVLTCSKPERDLMTPNHSWHMLKPRLHHPQKSKAASFATRKYCKYCSMHPELWISCSGLGFTCNRATWQSTQAKFRATTMYL